MSDIVVGTGAALGSALGLAISTVLQQRAAAAEPPKESLRFSLLLHLLRRPWWLVGILFEIGAYLLQFVALDHASLVLVQTLLVTGLLFALPLGAALSRRRIGSKDWLSASLVVAGIVVFLLAASPTGGRADATLREWLVLASVSAGIVALLVASTVRASGVRRAACLAAAAGVTNAVTAAISKSAVNLLDKGILHVLSSWPLYTLLATGTVGMLLVQSAFQASTLAASLPTLTVTDPVASTLIGTLLFGEVIGHDPLSILLEIAGAVTMVAGVFGLGHSPLVVPVRRRGAGGRRSD